MKDKWLAWAITIQRVQGSALDKAHIDDAKIEPVPGLVHVALSGVKNKQKKNNKKNQKLDDVVVQPVTIELLNAIKYSIEDENGVGRLADATKFE